MSFIRPEARTLLWNWRETLTGVAILIFGLWWSLATSSLMQWLGFAVIAAGVFTMVAGWQLARFRRGTGGPGIVTVTEGQVSYFGPLTGGVVALSELGRITYDPRGKPAHWVLSQPKQPDLYIPVTAEGADGLFDAFTSLPELQMQALLHQIENAPREPQVIWQKHPHKRLH